MPKTRLRTKFLLSLLLITSCLTCATLWIIRSNVRAQLMTQLSDDLSNSVGAFQDFQAQREINLTHSAQLLANLPSIKALMTTHDSATIQDASLDFWNLAGCDLFLLADPNGRVAAIRNKGAGIDRIVAEDSLTRSLRDPRPNYWWYGGGQLYEVFLQPIYFGAADKGTLLGVLVVGYEISRDLVGKLSRVVSSDVSFFYGDRLIVSTLQESNPQVLDASRSAKETRLGNETFLVRTVELTPGTSPVLHLTVFKSYDKASAFLQRLNKLLIALGIVSIVSGSILVFVISYTFTRPLAGLVAGVRALGKGDFDYPLTRSTTDEVAELTDAFDGMRHNLLRMQEDLLRAERLATIGQMAAFVSHDLRHPLTAVLGNAEFLAAPNLNERQREELYSEIRSSVEEMTDLIESLLQFSHSRESLQTAFLDVRETVDAAIRLVASRPEFHEITFCVMCDSGCATSFDRRRVERVIVNLLLNACQCVSPKTGEIEIHISEQPRAVRILIEDNGPGVSEEIRERLFQPFVSFGKPSGVGLGLTIAKKILQDHGGDICLQSTEPGRTIFSVMLPKEVCGDPVEIQGAASSRDPLGELLASDGSATN